MAGGSVTQQTVSTVWTHALSRSRIRAEFSRRIRQAATAARTLDELGRAFPAARLDAALTGSGASTLADALGLPYVQEVVANSIAVRTLYPHARTAIELGGQDAKIVFFEPDPRTGELTVSNMRMNGSCAGGTGAFLDEIASLLKVAPEDYDALAAAGERLLGRWLEGRIRRLERALAGMERGADAEEGISAARRTLARLKAYEGGSI